MIEKPSVRLVGEAARGWPNTQQQVVFGVSEVLPVWTDGEGRIPLDSRVWHTGGISKFAWALEWLNNARNRLQCTPQCVLFAAAYASRQLRKRPWDDGGYVGLGRAARRENWYAIPHLTVTAPARDGIPCAEDEGLGTTGCRS